MAKIVYKVDKSRGFRRKRRSKREASVYGSNKYKILVDSGFTEREARAAVAHGYLLKNLKKQIKERKARVAESMELFGWSREKAIAEAEKARREWNEDHGIELDNIHPEVSH